MRAEAVARQADQVLVGDLDRLTAALDMALLVAVGWDEKSEVFTPDRSHRLLGYQVCAVTGCGSEAWCKGPLCGACATRRARHPEQPIEAFLAGGISARRPGERLCALCCLPGFSRPAISNGLCLSCDALRSGRGESTEDFLSGDGPFGPPKPRATLGICAVLSCPRLVARQIHGLCDAHDQAWRVAGRPDLERFARTALPCRGDRRGRAVLRGLPPRVILEVLMGIQGCLESGRRLMPTQLRASVDCLRRRQVSSVDEIDVTAVTPAVRHFLSLTARCVALACSDLESEQSKDVWDLRHWGKHGSLSFIGTSALHINGHTMSPPITQGWLKAAAKAWAADALISVSKVSVQTTLNAVGVFSAHLARRDDAGEDPALLARRDIEAFLARLGHLEAAGTTTAFMRRQTIDVLSKVLRDCRALGLAGPGAPMAGLADEVALRRGDRPASLRREADDVGRALPEIVMAQLLSEENLGLLEQMSGPMARAAVERAAGVGRRTAELCSLSLSCLDFDDHVGEDGEHRTSPVLVHDMPKVDKVGVRLPIFEREVAIISAQRARVLATFPDTPPEHLVLFPRTLKNPDGTRSVSPSWLDRVMRQWVDALPRLDGPERDANGRPVPFPRHRVFPYAFRHSFAQRHADAGTPLDTLKELLGHDTVRSTLGYYRVTARRKRAAQDALGPLQLDAAGHRARPSLNGLTDAEALREQIGQVAVPFGVCTEPANVAADGHSCPFRHRCTGCTYFRTDPSYQPELTAYLAQLLADKERLATTMPQLAEWARSDAVPSNEEIDAVRLLIRANDEQLGTLDATERQRVEAAIATMRTERAALVNTFPVEFRGITRQARPTLFPAIEAAAEHRAAGG
jgi:integrase